MLNPRQILDFAPWQDVRFGSKKQTGPHVRVMSALPLKAGIDRQL
jgi:hypothetical protein